MLCKSCGCSEYDHKNGWCPTKFISAWKAPEVAHNRATTLPSEASERKKYPVGTGVLDYFPDAMAALARLSWEGNNQHNPGQPLHWAREKSTDQADTMQRHYLQRGTLDSDGQRHTAKMAWRALAMLQLEIEAEAGVNQYLSVDPALIKQR